MADRAQWVKDITTPGRIPVSAWGSFPFPGLPAFKLPSGVPSRNTVCVDNYDGTRNQLKGTKGWYPSPYMTGVQAIYNTSITDSNALLTHIFPVAWWNAARTDLKYLLAHRPTSNYETVAWTIHTGWLVYHMLLASNIYPTLWSDALQFARNSQWEPPAVGWNMSLPRSRGSVGRPAGYPGDSNGSLYPCWLWYDPGDFWTHGTYGNRTGDWEHKVQPGSMTYWDKSLWWSGSMLTVDSIVGLSKPVANLGLAINDIPWSAKLSFTTYAPTSKDSITLPVSENAVESWALANGLGTLQARARFFHRGGLVDLTKIYMEANTASQTLLKEDWILRADRIANLDYWTLVRGGVTAWQYRTSFPFVRSAETSVLEEVILLPTCRQDLKVIYNEFQKSWRQSFIVGPMIKFAAWLVNSAKTVFRGDFVGAVRAQVDLQKWGKQYAKQTANAPADPYFFFVTVPPLFLRSPGDAFNAFKDQVVLDESKEVSQTGTEALFTLTERGVRSLEKTLGVPIWALPVPVVPPAEVEEKKQVRIVQKDPSKSGIALPTSNKIWWGLGGVAALAGFLFWRRK